jgi:tetratricopeptide (TPR) repeat protein
MTSSTTKAHDDSAESRAAKLFLSHSTQDHAVVRALQRALGDLGQDVWSDARELRGGDPLSSEIQQAIEQAAGYAIVISSASLQSRWVGKELRHALEVQKQKQKQRHGNRYPVIPLLLDDTALGVLEGYFDEEPLCVRLGSVAGGVEAALHPILVALGKRLPTEVAPVPQSRAEPLEELVLHLDDLQIVQVQDGVRRASGRARLVYEPATPGRREVASAQSWRFVAPLGPLEADDLRWYLEKYAIWPSHVFRDRAHKVEDSLVAWGRLLHDAAMPAGPTDNVLAAWAGVDGHAGRRFSIHVDAAVELGASEADVTAAREAATLLLGLPWELLHDGDSFLFQGAKPTRVRRRLPNTRVLDVAVVATPIRILVVSPRPDDDACGYLDHRASALPLVEAMEELAGAVHLEILAPATLPALRAELDRAWHAREPYHVIHFDGHGVYDRRVGLGGLCFEDPGDTAQLERRRHQTVFTNELGPLLRDHRIPLVVLDACQTAQAEQASESVASEILKMGVASVVAMSHSVLVETARRFVATFYGALARGARVGDAMLEGQRQLKEDTLRGRIFGAGELHLEDWFVPVLFQEQDDPQLFRQTPARQTLDDFRTALKNRMGELPEPPAATSFVGRSRELLALERLLGRQRHAVLRGQGGEGKTALAAEFARWMVRSQQIRRAAFVSVETHGTARAVLDAIGRQLVPSYSVATFESPDAAEQAVARVLIEQPTLLVVDNLESILVPPYLAADTPEALFEDARDELEAILALCERLGRQGETRLLFTSRELLPVPFDGAASRCELHRLGREDAVKLVERVVSEGASTAGVADAARVEIEELVEAVNGHARTLALLAPAFRRLGVAATREALVDLMADMERRFPGDREQSLFASVELSLGRLSPENRDRARVLGLSHGGVNLVVLRMMMDWDKADVARLAGELIDTGLATPNRYNHLSLDPALCPYLRCTLDDADREALMRRWVDAMRAYVNFLYEQQRQNTELAATLTLLELPNLLALLAHVSRAEDAEATVDLAISLQSLLSPLARPRVLARVAETRDAAAARLGAVWNHVRFDAEQSRIENQLVGGQLRDALAGAQLLLRQARVAGEQAYPGADYDLAMACWLLGRALEMTGNAQQALPCLDDAQRRFEAIAQTQSSRAAARMASTCFTDKGVCLCSLGRLDEAAAAYEESTHRAEQQGDERQLAVAKGQLGTVRLLQRRYRDALDAHAEAREHFAKLGEPGSVAVIWHQTGEVYREAGQPEAAEDAYRRSLALEVQLGEVGGQANTLGALGNLYSDLDRAEEAASLYQQAADLFVAIGDAQAEGTCWSNLGDTLRKLKRWDEARQAIHRALECKEPFGHAADPWKSWGVLADIEAGVGNAGAAAHARAKAVACYLAYRRDGGENHNPDGRMSLAVAEKLRADDAAGAASFLGELSMHSELPNRLRPFVPALQAIAAGSRDRSEAEAPELHYTSAAELLVLLDVLEAEEAGVHEADAEPAASH